MLGPALAVTFVVLLVLGLVRWHEAPPTTVSDICTLLAGKPGWYRSLAQSEARWGVPAAIQMAIVFQESSFRARARPPRRWLWGFIPWRRPSTAYGYAQALDGTWREYKDQVARTGASRRHFPDITDFVGWYLATIHQQTAVAKSDAFNLYLAYHEGPGGFARGRYRAKPWLMKVADRVADRAETYQRQLDACESDLRRVSLWRRWRAGGIALGIAAITALAWRRHTRARPPRGRSR